MSRLLQARDLGITWGDNTDYWSWKKNDTEDARFPELAELVRVCWLEINGRIDSSILSPGKEYSVYLIYKVDLDTQGLKLPYYQTATIDFNGEKTETVLNLDSGTLEAYTGGSGWYQVELGKFYNTGSGPVHAQLQGAEAENWKSGLTVAGMEFRQVDGEGMEESRQDGVGDEAGQANETGMKHRQILFLSLLFVVGSCSAYLYLR